MDAGSLAGPAYRMPVYLTIVFCLIGNPGACSEIRPNLADDFPMVGLAECQQMGERIAAEYVDMHPAWRVDRIKCRIGIPPPEQDA